MTTHQRSQQRHFALTAPRVDILQQEVNDALAATAGERMEAAVALLDAAYDLWRTRGIADDEGLCRLPHCTQQRRRGLCSDRRDGGPATGHPEKDLPDVERLREIRKQHGELG